MPSPGRCRSGIHSSSTAAPTTITTVPMASPVCRADALVEDVPRVQPEPGPHLQRAREAVAEQADVELHQPKPEQAGPRR